MQTFALKKENNWNKIRIYEIFVRSESVMLALFNELKVAKFILLNYHYFNLNYSERKNNSRVQPESAIGIRAQLFRVDEIQGGRRIFIVGADFKPAHWKMNKKMRLQRNSSPL